MRVTVYVVSPTLLSIMNSRAFSSCLVCPARQLSYDHLKLGSGRPQSLFNRALSLTHTRVLLNSRPVTLTRRLWFHQLARAHQPLDLVARTFVWCAAVNSRVVPIKLESKPLEYNFEGILITLVMLYMYYNLFLVWIFLAGGYHRHL